VVVAVAVIAPNAVIAPSAVGAIAVVLPLLVLVAMAVRIEVDGVATTARIVRNAVNEVGAMIVAAAADAMSVPIVKSAAIPIAYRARGL
jgi:hypothetical protein